MTFRYLTSGESHGKALNAIIEGLPSGLEISTDFINNELKKRQQGYGRGGRMKIETDIVEIKSGVRFGKTTGAPICVEIINKDWENWQIPMSTDVQDENCEEVKSKTITKIRPGHADLAGALKYNHKDIRNILERSSARETTTRVAVGGFAKLLLKEFGVEIFSHVTNIGGVKTPVCTDYNHIKENIKTSEVNCFDHEISEKMKLKIDEAKEKGVSLGGEIEIIAQNIPIGLGSFVHWDRKLDGLIAQGMMSIPAIKSVEIGMGSDVANYEGTDVHDEILPKENGKYPHKTNNAGGIEGGMTNGEPIVIKIAMKPIPTMVSALNSVDFITNEPLNAHVERADVCAVPACGIVAEAMLANVLTKAFLEKFGGDSIAEIKQNYENYMRQIQK